MNNQLNFIIKSIDRISDKFSNLSIRFGYGVLTYMHIIEIDSENVFDDHEFRLMEFEIIDEFNQLFPDDDLLITSSKNYILNENVKYVKRPIYSSSMNIYLQNAIGFSYLEQGHLKNYKDFFAGIDRSQNFFKAIESSNYFYKSGFNYALNIRKFTSDIEEHLEALESVIVKTNELSSKVYLSRNPDAINNNSLKLDFDSNVSNESNLAMAA